MSESQKYQRKKNILIILFMFLLVVFVCIICGIFIYAKNNPAQKFISPDEIEIKQVNTLDYSITADSSYVTITKPNSFIVTENGEEFKLILTELGEIKVSKGGIEDSIEIIQNDNNINNNIKVIYQTENESLILTEAGELYKLINTEIVDNQLKVGQILTNMEVKDLIYVGAGSDTAFALNEKDKLINISSLKEYNGVIREIKTQTSTIYVYEDHSFGLEEGKVFVDDYNKVIKINISFDNKIIADNNVIYEINSADNTLSTSSLGEFKKIGYKKEQNDNTYKITLLSNTGMYDFYSSYYYAK